MADAVPQSDLAIIGFTVLAFAATIAIVGLFVGVTILLLTWGYSLWGGFAYGVKDGAGYITNNGTFVRSFISAEIRKTYGINYGIWVQQFLKRWDHVLFPRLDVIAKAVKESVFSPEPHIWELNSVIHHRLIVVHKVISFLHIHFFVYLIPYVTGSYHYSVFIIKVLVTFSSYCWTECQPIVLFVREYYKIIGWTLCAIATIPLTIRAVRLFRWLKSLHWNALFRALRIGVFHFPIAFWKNLYEAGGTVFTTHTMKETPESVVNRIKLKAEKGEMTPKDSKVRKPNFGLVEAAPQPKKGENKEKHGKSMGRSAGEKFKENH